MLQFLSSLLCVVTNNLFFLHYFFFLFLFSSFPSRQECSQCFWYSNARPSRHGVHITTSTCKQFFTQTLNSYSLTEMSTRGHWMGEELWLHGKLFFSSLLRFKVILVRVAAKRRRGEKKRGQNSRRRSLIVRPVPKFTWLTAVATKMNETLTLLFNAFRCWYII